MAVYTKRIALAVSIGSPVVLATCPNGLVWVLRDVNLFNNAAGAASYVQVSVGSPGGTAVFFAQFNMAAATSAHWSGSLTMNAGDTLWATSSSGNLEVTATAYEFPVA